MATTSGTSLQAAALNARTVDVKVILQRADPRWVFVDQKLNRATMKTPDRVDEVIRNPSEPAPAPHARKPF